MSNDVPLRDAAQALLTAWEAVQALDPPMTHTEADSLSRAEDAGNDAAASLRAALAAADTAPVELRAAAQEYREAFLAVDGAMGVTAEQWRAMSDRFNAADKRLVEALAAADGTTPTQPDEVLVWEGAFGQLAASLLGGPKYSERGWDANQRVRVVATPATEAP